MTKLATIGSRAGASVLTLWLISVAFFGLVELAPGDFAVTTSTMGTTDADRSAMRKSLGLDQSVVKRYWHWVGNLANGDLGISWWARRPIAEFVAEPVKHSLWLAGVAALFALPLGMALGLLTTATRRSLFDRGVATTAVAVASVPDFLIAYGLMAWLGVHLGWLPVHTFFADDLSFADRLHATALPVLSLAAALVTPAYKATRAALSAELAASYVEMARLKGLSETRILLVHALPNAAAPILNSLVQLAANLLVGLVVIEIIFEYPGFGKLLVHAVIIRDVPLVLACSLVCASVYVVLVLLADVLAVLTNPRLSHRPKSGGSRLFPAPKRRRTRALMQMPGRIRPEVAIVDPLHKRER
jgi:peptide/nickel transport system permease protein